MQSLIRVWTLLSCLVTTHFAPFQKCWCNCFLMILEFALIFCSVQSKIFFSCLHQSRQFHGETLNLLRTTLSDMFLAHNHFWPNVASSVNPGFQTPEEKNESKTLKTRVLVAFSIIDEIIPIFNCYAAAANFQFLIEGISNVFLSWYSHGLFVIFSCQLLLQLFLISFSLLENKLAKALALWLVRKCVFLR